MRVSKLILPLIITLILFGAYFAFTRHPLLVDAFGDSREAILGPRLGYLRFAAFAALFFLAVRLFDVIVFDVMLAKRRVKAPLLLRQIVLVGLLALLLASAFSLIFERDLLGILTAGTVVAAVIGLALQDTLGNLFSGISLHVEHTFEPGDVVRAGSHIGVVETTNWRATRLRSFNNNLVVVPNSIIARESLEIFPRTNLNATIVTVGIGYHVPPAKVIPILEHAATNVEGVSGEIACFARVGDFGDSAIIYEIKYWTREYHRTPPINAEIRRAVWYALRRHGISIPFPIRTLQRYEEPGPEPEVPMDEVRERLRHVDLLAPLSREEVNAVVADVERFTYARGETIIGYGDAGDSMFVIHEGTVSVRVRGDKGMQEIAILEPGSVFGEMALLTGESRAADVVALTDVTAFEISRDSLQPVLQRNPELASALSQKMTARRDETAQAAAPEQREQDHTTMLRRIRDYFGLWHS